MKTTKNINVIILCLLVVLLNPLCCMGIKTFLYSLGAPRAHTNFHFMIYELINLFVALIILFAFKQQHILHCKTKGLLKGLWSGMIFFILAIMSCTIFVSDAAAQKTAYKSTPEMIYFCIFVLLVGVAEELVFRGVITDLLLKHYGKSTSGIWISVILSGVLFGFAHITNIISGQSVEKTIIQMLSVSMTGMLFAAIYIRHKNIFAPAILHAVLDFFTMFKQGVFENASIAYTATPIDFWPSLRQSLISQSIFLIVAIFLLRPKKIKQLLA